MYKITYKCAQSKGTMPVTISRYSEGKDGLRKLKDVVSKEAVNGEYTIEEIPDPDLTQIDIIQKDVDTLKADQQAMWNEMATSYQNGVNKA